MIPTPNKFKLVAGSGEGATPLNAFDKALLSAGAGNLNLLKVSSILPPQAEYEPDLHITPGSLVPVAYGTISSQTPGETISAAVAVGIPEDSNSFGIIMEHSDICSREEIEEYIRNMVVEGFKTRGLTFKGIKVCATEHKVKNCGSAFAGVILWY